MLEVSTLGTLILRQIGKGVEQDLDIVGLIKVEGS